MNKEKDFIRPVRNSYRHDVCGFWATMELSIAEAFAREPKFYDNMFCTKCADYFPIKEFSWAGQPKTKIGE